MHVGHAHGRIPPVCGWDRETPDQKGVALIPSLSYEENPDRYDVVELRYMVEWKTSSKSKERLLEVDPDQVYPFIEE